LKACVAPAKILCCCAEHVLLHKLFNHQCIASTVLAVTAFKHTSFRFAGKQNISAS
jgi:hypothetical protein